MATGKKLYTLAHRRAALWQQSDPLASGTICKLAQDDIRTGETPCAVAACAAYLLDRPVQRRLGRSGVCINVMSVKAQTALEAQTVTRAKANGLDIIMRQQRTGQRLCQRLWHSNLIAVFAGISRT